MEQDLSGSRLTTGTTDIHVKLEEELAHFKNREAALVLVRDMLLI